MSVLTLVRHGQASFFAADYDQLSEAGEAQARLLGDYLAHQDGGIDEVYVGPRRRQQQTATLAGEQYCNAGRPWPEPVVLEELDEYDLAGLLGRLAPALADRDPAFAAMVAAVRRSAEHERDRTFWPMFQALTAHWQTSTDAVEAVEGWAAFRDRVRRGVERVTGHSRSRRRVVAVTSGGFIGTAAALALAAPDQTALELNWRLRNGSLTRFVFTAGRRTLDEFNAVPHLPDPALWTYR
jgi:broad specificity phosphatase PhoE